MGTRDMDLNSETSNSILGWVMAAVAGVGAVLASAVRGERLRNRVDSVAADVARHEEVLHLVRRDLHDIRNAVHVMQALQEREIERTK
tara:strand:- start:1160 stop:1423 length:264 start_codon:yes stop_codon:yes gene_type:complete